jgi:hypothetical protein
LPFLFLLGFPPRFPQKIGVSSCYRDWGAAQILFGLRNNFSPPAIIRHTRLAYRSTKKDLGQLGEQISKEAQGLCLTNPNFLTYSMGGIILRVIKSMHPDFAVARVVRPIMNQKLLINEGIGNCSCI